MHPYNYVDGIHKKSLSLSIYIYYYVEIIHYFCAFYFLFTEPRLKDFYQMFVHHIVTQFLILGSYYENQFKFGTVVMILHDIADPFLDSAKVFFYLERQKIADILFICFAFVFFFSRCLLYPTLIIIPAITTACKDRLFCMRHTVILCLCILSAINFAWCHTIIKMAIKFYKDGRVKDDNSKESRNLINKIK